MTRRLFRLSWIMFTRLQLTNARTLSQGLKNDILWNSLSGREHQIIGKIIARYNNFFAANCPVTVKINYSHTDNRGNGIYI